MKVQQIVALLFTLFGFTLAAISQAECQAIYDRCQVSLEMQAASGAPFGSLDPSSQAVGLPGLLTTPVSAIDLASILASGDVARFTAGLTVYTKFVSFGNFDFCASLPNAHSCVVPALRVALGPQVLEGPTLGYCLPETCSGDDFYTLSTDCAIQRLLNLSNTATRALDQAIAIEAGLDTYLDDNPVVASDIAQIVGSTLNLTNFTTTDLEQMIGGLISLESKYIDQIKQAAGALGVIQSSVATAKPFCTDQRDNTLDGKTIGFIVVATIIFGTVAFATMYELFVLPVMLRQAEGKPFVFSFRLSKADYDKIGQFPHLESRLDFVRTLSAYSALDTLLNKPIKGDFVSLNGIRVLSTGYIILGHTFLLYTFQCSNMFPAAIDYTHKFESMFIVGAFAAVDVFFLLSGFLATYVMLRKNHFGWVTWDSVMSVRFLPRFFTQWALVVFHRYLRLTPLYMFVLLFWIGPTRYVADGPLWPAVGNIDPKCDDHWWQNLLYINNVLPTDTPAASTCMGWSWYLANDFMFYCFVPFVLAAYHLNIWAGRSVLMSVFLQNIIASGVISHQKKMSITTLDAAYSQDLYGRPWTRSAPFFVGVALALVFYEKKQANGGKVPKVPMSWFAGAGYFVSGLVAVGLTYVLPWDNYAKDGLFAHGSWPQWGCDIYNAINRPFTAVGLAGLFHLFFCGHGWLFKPFLEHPLFDPLAKLGYGAYLWHLVYLSIFVTSRSSALTFSRAHIAWLFLPTLVFAFATSFLTFLFVEQPCANLGNKFILWLTGAQRKQQAQKKLASVNPNKMDEALLASDHAVSP